MRRGGTSRSSHAPGASIVGRVAPILIVMLALVGRASAQPAGATSTLAGQIELARLVDVAAERLRIAVEYDAAALKGVVTLRLGAEVSDDELWSLTNRVLASRGFTTVRMPGSSVVSIVRITDAPGLSGLRDIDDGAPPQSRLPEAGFTTVVVRLEHRAPKDVLEGIAKVLSKPAGSAVALGDPLVPRGLIVISDLVPRIEQAMSLVRLLDAPAGPTVVEEIAASNVPGAALAALVTQVAAKREAVSGEKVPGDVLPSPNGNAVLLVAPQERAEYWRALVAGLDRRERVETATYTPAVFGAKEVGSLIEQSIREGPVAGAGGMPDERWRLVVDDLTGTLIVTGTPSQHEAIRALIERLDSTPRSARRPVRSFTIRNRNITELAEVLRGLLGAGVLEGDTPAPEGAKPIQGIIPADLPPPGSTLLVPIPPVGGSPPEAPSPRDPGVERVDSGARLGAAGYPGGSPQGDAPLVITIDEGTSTLIAMGDPRLLEQLAALIERLDVRQPQVMLEVLLVSLTDAQTLDLGVELQAMDLSGDTIWRLASLFGLAPGAGGEGDAATGTGLTGVVLNPGDFSVVVRALKTINDGRSLSMPKVLVGNNQQATLDSILEQPFASTNASSTVATTSFGGSSAAGTQVSIKPQIAEGDHLILDYQVSLSSFTGAAANRNVPPPKQTNKVASTATIPDGFTVVVGGIDLTNDSRAVSQVPLVARIPIVGEAFKNRSKINNRTRFYVFIRANVLRARGFEDLKYISTTDAASAAVDDGFPKVEPRVIR